MAGPASRALDYLALQGKPSRHGEVLDLGQGFFAPQDLLSHFGVQRILQLHFNHVDGVDSPLSALDKGAGQFQHVLIAVGAVDGEEDSVFVHQG